MNSSDSGGVWEECGNETFWKDCDGVTRREMGISAQALWNFVKSRLEGLSVVEFLR